MLLAEGPRGLKVVHCSAEAVRAGIRPGCPLADARAVFSGTGVRRGFSSRTPAWRRADPLADRAALRRLALAAQRFSPLVGVEETDPPESLLLDITGCAPLWGDEQGLLSAVVGEFQTRGYRVHAVVSDTIGCAWAVARVRETGCVPSGEELAALRPLPIATLRLPPEAVQRLREFEIVCIKDLLALPRESLPARFGPEVLRRLDQALGRLPEGIVPERFAEPLVVAWTGEEPLRDDLALAALHRTLFERLLEALAPQRAGVVEWRSVFRTETSAALVWEFRLARPTADLRHLDQLFRLRCERESLPAAVAGISLELLRAGVLGEQQTTLFDDPRISSERDLQQLVDRLTSRLGEGAVLQPVFVPDPQPEASYRWEPFVLSARRTALPADLNRPCRLLSPPQPIAATSIVPEGPPLKVFWQGRPWQVTHAWGPERIETGWWRTKDVCRDYYRVETEHGRHLWLFRQRATGQWFVHGFFE